MSIMEAQLCNFKSQIENAIISGGARGKESIIRSSTLINLIHDAVKNDFIEAGVNPSNIFPRLHDTRPEVKLAGYLKQKDQDVCIVPSNIEQVSTMIDWGPLAFENKIDVYGYNYSLNTLVVNVRSQMSSLTKNSDTLFERTFAEALNLHMRYPEMVLGEVYLIPVHEYDDEAVRQNTISFRNRQTDLEKYISFFNSINNRPRDGEYYAYERCALMIVDFNQTVPHLFRDSKELIQNRLISPRFDIEYEALNYQGFINDILDVYAQRFDIDNILHTD